jgi:predicted TIM-barrel fold metal-dependent hydrolase
LAEAPVDELTWKPAWQLPDPMASGELSPQAGQRGDDLPSRRRLPGCPAGCYDPAQRVKDMDLDGVHAALCFPSFPSFGGGVFQRAKDKELALACVRAWNDFQLDEWCAAAPDRLIPLSLVPTWDPDLAAAEVERVAAKGSIAELNARRILRFNG